MVSIRLQSEHHTPRELPIDEGSTVDGLKMLPHRPRPPLQEILLDQYVTRDHLHAAALSDQSIAQANLIRDKRKEIEYYQAVRRERQMNPGAVFGHGYAGWGNGHTDGKTRLVYPSHRRRPGTRRTKELRIGRKDMNTQADQLEELVPVRLDIEWDKIKLRDTFTWNLHDRVISPDLFAEQLIEDFKVPPEQATHLGQLVAQSVKDQIQDFYPQVFIEEEALDPHLPYHAYKNDEMRILIKLNITIGQHNLVDQFEWDINNPLNSPEEFAKQMTRDLSLSGEFTTAIAHCIREQSQLFSKSLYVTGHPFDGRPLEDADLRDAFLPSPLPSVFRPIQQAKEFTPCLWELNDAELDRTENSLSREQRRQKRSVNRRGGPALPDLKDRQRTVRTLVVSSVIPGAAESLDDSRIFKRVEGTSGRGRRGGAGRRGDDDSDLSDSEDSAAESPPSASNQIVYNTSRTRGTRGAASAAQVAMRASLAQSATPEPSLLHHHETRTSARRFGGRDVREDSYAIDSLIVRLRVNQEKLRRLLEGDKRVRIKGEPSQQQSAFATTSTTPFGTPSTRSRDLPPPQSITNSSSQQPSQRQSQASPQRQAQENASGSTNGYGIGGTATTVPAQNASTLQIGAIDATGPPLGEPQPPPPPWLISALSTLSESYPDDSFEGMMRYAIVNMQTGILHPNSAIHQTTLPPHSRAQWLPRIRCHDCPGKLYTPGPGMTVDGFEVHLKLKQHRDRVEERKASATPSTTAATYPA
ncbi:MAG: SWI/SNF chromatin-remodeling complex subunit [Peltula sp. TS41687]|nr:MAG: SWI/SNF chromatin-remodeling complex subunit [Peltula sp. TS41687]